MRIRKIKTGSGKHAIQVVSKHDGQLKVHKHIGTFENEAQRKTLHEKAHQYIQEITGQTSLLDLLNSVKPSEIKITESRPYFLYQMLCRVYDKVGLNSVNDPVIKDLVIARIFHPASKLETQEILEEFFGRNYAINTLYRHLKKSMKAGMKECIQTALIKFARNELGDSLKLVFYDVTTLYFESHLQTGIRAMGFSKDHRTQDTQIVVGLVVNSQGFPLYFDVFNGKTFEGNTLIPVIKKIKALLSNTSFVVVADAAMISQSNMEQMSEQGIEFIVGARVANLSGSVIDQISSELSKEDGKTIEVTWRHQRLICEYSSKRAVKDRSDRLKQLTRAKQILATPNTMIRRYRFIQAVDKRYCLNEDLITKSEKLEGIKGFVTNTTLPQDVIIERYRDLWKVEHVFRVTKSDLKARPIFHRVDEAIQAHLIVVFAGLAVSRYIEIKSGLSIQRVLKISRRLLRHKVSNARTGESAFIETTIENPKIRDQIEELKLLGH